MVATLVQVHNDPNCPYVVAIGVSVCNMQHDTFDKRIATDIALGRAKQHHKEYKLKDKRLRHYDGYPIWLSDEINAFILSCIKYYKDKSILHPKIVFV
jgi:hypothetical protein